MNPVVAANPSHENLLNFKNVVILNILMDNTEFEATSDTNFSKASLRMFEEVVDDAKRDLDTFSPERGKVCENKEFCGLVLEEEEFWDLLEVVLEASRDVNDYEPPEQQLLSAVSKGVMDLPMTEVAIQLDLMLL